MVVAGQAGAEGLVRGAAPAADSPWWVVVEGGGRMPMAVLWRPDVAPGHFPSPPAVDASTCRIAVTDTEGNPIEAARVAPYRAAEPDVESQRPALIAGWRPWLPPARVDERGTASIIVSGQRLTEFRASAPGYRNQMLTCLQGVAEVVLEGAHPTEFEVRNTTGDLLTHALVRDETGAPVAVTDAVGRVEVDPILLVGRVWLELPTGTVYEASMDHAWQAETRPRVVLARLRSESRSGQFRLAEGAAPGGVIRLWRAPRWPWRTLDARAAPPLVRTTGLSYALQTLPGEGLWVAAEGVGYAFCRFDGEAEASETGPRSLRRGRPAACPPTLRSATDLEGTVVDDVGAPIADADVWISWGFGFDPAEPTVLPGAHAGSDARMLLRTDQDGRFAAGRLTRPTRPFFGSSTAGLLQSLLVTVERPGYLPILRQPLERFASSRGPLRVVLQRGVHVSGRVVDAATGRPVGAGEVALGRFSVERGAVLLRSLSSLNAVSGQFGRLRVSDIEPSGDFEVTAWPGRYDLGVQAPGKAFFVRRDLEVTAEGLDLGAIYLRSERAIVGEVLDEHFVPVPAARVLAAGSVDPGIDGPRRTELLEGMRTRAEYRTDELGRFRVAGLSEDSRVDLEVSAPGLANERLTAVAPTGMASLQVVMQREAVVEGRVTYADKPVQTWVRLRQSAHSSRESWVERSTTADGTFRVAGLKAGRYDVLASGAGELEDAATSLQLIAGDKVEIVLELGGAPGSLAGTVTADGAGLPGVEIRAGRRRTVTDETGRYEVNGLPRGTVLVSATLNAAAGEHAHPRIGESIEVGSRPVRLDFDFTAFEIRGRVVRADGSPAAGAKLSLFRKGGGLPPTRSAVVGSDGTFGVELVAGVYDLLVTNEPGRNLTETLRVRGPRSDVEIQIPDNLRIEGVVRGLTPEAMSLLRITARNDELEARTTKVDPQGRFSIDELPSRDWLVIGMVIGQGQRAERQVRIKGSEAFVDLEFARLPEVRGTVRLDGLPLQGAPMLMMRDRELAGARRVWTRHDGSFQFFDLEPGKYHLGVGGDLRAITVDSDEVLAIDLVSGRVEGTAVDPRTSAVLSGSPVHLWPRVVGRAEAEAFGAARRSFTDSDGRFSFEQVPQGSWLLEVDGIPGARVPVEVAPGANVVLRMN